MRIHWTFADLDQLPATMHYEIIHGELFAMKAPHHNHQRVCGRFFRALDAWSDDSGLGVPSVAPGLLFSDADTVIPDVTWTNHERLTQLLDVEGHLQGAPELVIEVLSYSAGGEQRDRETKLHLYAMQGVLEYWIADRLAQQIEVYRRVEQNGQDHPTLTLVATLQADDTLTSPLLPGFTCLVAWFFL